MNPKFIIALSAAILFTFGIAVFFFVFYCALSACLAYDYVQCSLKDGYWWPNPPPKEEP